MSPDATISNSRVILTGRGFPCFYNKNTEPGIVREET